MSRKLRVLMAGETHYLASGFGTYTEEILKGLQATGKYEVAEFAAYGRYSSHQKHPWKYYANTPEASEPKNVQDLYNSRPPFVFGQFRFDKVVVDFKPDVVLTYRDPWMDAFIAESPSRDFFHWVWMPTVDSSPQKPEWLCDFHSCDGVLCYSEFGIKTLQEHSNNRIKPFGCATPGKDLSLYKPVENRAKLRQDLNLSPNINIVGTVMRNQKRKLFIELMKAFRLFLDQAPAAIADKTYLYLHTSYPEKSGWNLVDGMKSYDLEGRILSTYICKNCRQFFCRVFSGAQTYCPSCKIRSCVCPSVSVCLTREELVKIYNLFDIYVQYAICEGLGIPAVEAAACGTPVAAVNYSAMEDVVRFTNGYPIEPAVLPREMETNADRAWPNNQDLANVLKHHFSLDKGLAQKKRDRSRDGAANRYTTEQAVKQWEKYLDSVDLSKIKRKWDEPPRHINIPQSIPENMSFEQFVNWCGVTMLQDPEYVFSYKGLRFLKWLNEGAIIDFGTLDPFDPEKLFNIMQNYAHAKNQFEHLRTNPQLLLQENFIKEAHARI